jgi:hypothetical protein
MQAMESETSSVTPTQSERGRRRRTDRKRVSNERMKRHLLTDATLLHPTYREGLESVLESNRDEWAQSLVTPGANEGR